MNTLQVISMDSIKFDPHQPRKVISEQSVLNLAKSLKVEGLIHPIEVDVDHRIIVGEMRYRAAKSLEWTTIEARVNDSKMTPYERLRRQMSENLQQSGSKGGGESMNPIDTARAWQKLYELKTGKRYQSNLQPHSGFPGPLLDIAREVGVTKETVWEYMQMLNEPKHVIEDILRGRPKSSYRAANTAPEEMRKELKDKIARGEFTNRDQVREISVLSNKIPELGRLNMERQFTKETTYINRIFSCIANLALSIKAVPIDRINPREQRMIRAQLMWLQDKITLYLKGGE